MSATIVYRRAKMGDVRRMHKLLNHFAFSENRELLPRAISEIYENLQQFHIAEDDGNVVGTCALYVTWDNLAEVKALCVDEAYQKRGIGTRLLQACLEDAARLDIRRVFTLTIQTGFFERQGFAHVSKDALPHKVWTECVRCPYFPDRCIEYAMVLDLPGPGPTPPKIAVTPKSLGFHAPEEGLMIPSEPRIPGKPEPETPARET